MFTKFIKNNKLTCIAILAMVALFIFQIRTTATWKNNRSIIHDITSYYSYLPAAFIYQDFQFNYRYNLPQDEPRDHVWVNVRGDTVFQKMTMGLSYFYLPTFYAAHIYTLGQEKYNANGFSKPYQFGMSLNTLLVGILGLFTMALLLLRFFSDRISAITLICLFAGTNLLYYITGAPGLSHPYSFFLIALMILVSMAYFKKPSYLLLFAGAVIVGWIVLIRPTNLILCLFPLLLGFHKPFYKTLTENFLLNYRSWLVLFFGLILPWIPQLLYWKYATGQWFFYSYDQEGFYFLKSHLWDGLFGFRKGWFIYTPMMLLALAGLIFGKRHSTFRRAGLILLPLFCFVVFSWWCWWYGGSFGSRVMIDAYPIMAIGLGLAIKEGISGMWLKRLGTAFILVFFIVLNLNQVWQYNIGMLHWDSMTMPAYRSIFLKSKPPGNYEQLLVHPDYEKAKKEGE